MNVLIIPDGFKDSLSAQGVADAMEQGVQISSPGAKVFKLVASDGGDGFLKAVSYYKPTLEWVNVETSDPLGRAISASYLYDDQNKTAYVELAAASGIELLAADQRRVMETSTLGTGVLMKHAQNNGAELVYIGLGGSATNDAAIGIASAFGWEFLDINGDSLVPCGGNLNLIKKVRAPKESPGLKITAINDVQNPLYGPTGAAHTYARQKGGSSLQIELLDSGLKHLDGLIKRDFKKDAALVPGAGAAGGAAYGLKVFFDADFKAGTSFMLGLSGFYEVLEKIKIDLIITGEGSIDGQTEHGKLISGIVKEARPYKVPVFAICGLNKLNHEQESALGLAGVKQLYSPDQPEGYSFSHAAALVVERTKEILAGL